MVLSGSRKTHPSTSRLRILHTKAERGHSSTGCYLECVFISQGQRHISNAARGYGQKPANSKMKTQLRGLNPLAWSQETRNCSHMGIRGAWLEGFELYRALVEVYTKRQLSYSEDIEYAFSGITAALTKRFGWNFISCLPESLIVYTLLWTPSYKANRPLISDNQADMQGIKPFPSWSRTGWTGDINYGLVKCTGFRSTSCVGPLAMIL
ncbi:uncharacterized protein K441DRAFT_725196 [Cenococcum geophilum 1.58]|uniref:uncharacterized protein n=1 Tax=Cenococcum geophilum 1.58 TaxID=794803 RepID=UPI00358E6927|nr:hypothetical protein K441DRAFT_725196 [Cenococcum geophilum 1.58]